MRKQLVNIFFLLSILSLMFGCQAMEEEEQNLGSNSNTSHKEATFPVTVTDATGVEVTINKKPEAIISLIPSNTEIAYALGLGEQVIAVTENDTYPEDVKNKEIIGGFQLNFEKIIALNPDLVLAHGLNGDIDQLRAAGLTVLVVNNFEASFADVYESIKLIAEATGGDSEGTQLISEMRNRLQVVIDKAKQVEEKKNVWVEIDSTLYTTGQGTFLNEMLMMIEATNIAGSEQGWPQFSDEVIINSNPDIIIATYKGAINTITNRSGWENVNAVKNNDTYEVDADLFSRAGPRLVEGVEQLATLIYPKIYK